MRILKFLLTATIMVLILGGMSFFLGRELLLFLSLNRLKDSLRLMRRVELKGEYNVECRTKGSMETDEAGLFTTQLRFISDTDYVVEAVCGQFTLNPIEIETNRLFPLVKKTAGNSGVIWGLEPGGITVQVLGRSGSVLVENGEVSSASLAGLEIVPGPVSNCEGYGFACCQEDLTQGMGEQLEGVSDCPKNCYSSCAPRPVVLSFNTQPFFEQNTRTVPINSNQEVVFMFVISDTDLNEFTDTTLAEESNPLLDLADTFNAFVQSVFKNDQAKQATALKISIDFGDGQTEELVELQGNTRHVYTCKQATCTYTAVIKAQKGLVESADNALAKAEIRVSN